AAITGTPKPGTAGSYPITLTATNGVPPDATTNVTLEVKPAAQPAVDAKVIRQAILMGDMYLNRGMYDDAINEYQRGLNADPGNRVLQKKIERARTGKRILGNR